MTVLWEILVKEDILVDTFWINFQCIFARKQVYLLLFYFQIPSQWKTVLCFMQICFYTYCSCLALNCSVWIAEVICGCLLIVGSVLLPQCCTSTLSNWKGVYKCYWQKNNKHCFKDPGIVSVVHTVWIFVLPYVYILIFFITKAMD